MIHTVTVPQIVVQHNLKLKSSTYFCFELHLGSDSEVQLCFCFWVAYFHKWSLNPFPCWICLEEAVVFYTLNEIIETLLRALNGIFQGKCIFYTILLKAEVWWWLDKVCFWLFVGLRNLLAKVSACRCRKKHSHTRRFFNTRADVSPIKDLSLTSYHQKRNFVNQTDFRIIWMCF